jgi:S1-C subfamily serine protease
MRHQTGRRVFAYLLMAVLAAALLGCGSSPSGQSPATGPTLTTGAGSRQGGPPAAAGTTSSPQHLAELGITGKPSGGEPQGLLVTGFVSSSENAPLAVIGVKEGDVIVSCNGDQQQIAVRLLAAIEGLQERGEPVTLVVMREGKELKLERTEKLPGSEAGQNPK